MQGKGLCRKYLCAHVAREGPGERVEEAESRAEIILKANRKGNSSRSSRRCRDESGGKWTSKREGQSRKKRERGDKNFSIILIIFEIAFNTSWPQSPLLLLLLLLLCSWCVKPSTATLALQDWAIADKLLWLATWQIGGLAGAAADAIHTRASERVGCNPRRSTRTSLGLAKGCEGCHSCLLLPAACCLVPAALICANVA